MALARAGSLKCGDLQKGVQQWNSITRPQPSLLEHLRRLQHHSPTGRQLCKQGRPVGLYTPCLLSSSSYQRLGFPAPTAHQPVPGKRAHQPIHHLLCFLWIVFFKHPNSPKQTGKSHKPVSREDDNGFVSLQRKQMKRYDDKIHCRTPFASSFTFWIRRAVRSHSLPTQVLFAFFLLHI